MISKNQIKQIQTLHLKKNRDAHKLFLAEGINTVKELIKKKSNCIKELYLTESFLASNLESIQSNKITHYIISESELKKISLQISPNNVLAICNYLERTDTKLNFESGFSLYLDDIRDPGNFGTIIRLADWYGISLIYCSPDSCDFYNPKVIQASMGAFLRVNVLHSTLANVIKNSNVKNVYGAVLNGQNIYKEKLSNGIIVIGNEANGISKENLNLITHPISIPSHPESDAESLNAAMASSIIVSEFYRQLAIS